MEPVRAVAVENRRGFLGQAIAVLCGGAALLVPGVVGLISFLSPLRQKSQSGDLMKLATLEMLPDDGSPRKFSVIADRIDAWNLFPRQAIGDVYLRRAGKADVLALQARCPHAGCPINFVSGAEGGRFRCPCHTTPSFDLGGKRLERDSMSPRDMDQLDVEIRNGSEVWVKFQTFRTGTAAKVAQA